MLFFRIYHLSAKKYIGIWKIALCTPSLQLPQLLETQSVILHFRPAFYGKNKGKNGVFWFGGGCGMQDKIMLKIFGTIIKNA